MADIKFISGEGRPRVVVIWPNELSSIIGNDPPVYTSTSVTSTNIGLTAVKLNMRVASYRVISGQPNRLVWGKVTAIDTNELTVDQWVGGTPTDGQYCFMNGWVIDLPYCQELLETFTPDQLVHSLFRSRREVVFFGWKYAAQLNYSDFIRADVLLALRPALNMREFDRLLLIPRVDRMMRQYNVMYDGEVQIARHATRGHKKVVFRFKAKENVQFPIPTKGWGYGYGKAFGSNSS